MVIKDFIVRNMVKAMEDRYNKLKELHAPAIVVEGTAKMLADLKAGNVKVGGDQSLLVKSYSSFEVKKGRGGKEYVEFDNGVKFFPHARYGMFISM